MTGEDIKVDRSDLGLTQKELASKLKIGESTLRLWESQSELTERVENNYKLRMKAVGL